MGPLTPEAWARYGPGQEASLLINGAPALA
jgi:hypothetical protein